MEAPVQDGADPVRMSHKKSRAILKKEKRRKKRQALAKLRDADDKEEERKFEEFEDEIQYEIERQRLHEEWLLREQKAQEEFLQKKQKEEAAKRREEEERKLIEEWAEQENRQKDGDPELVKKKQREEAVQKMLDEAESQLENGDTWHNPEAPDGYGTEKDRANCPFYLKTGACRFGERCSRKHGYPSSSQTLLIRGMFVSYGMEQCRRDDYDTDASLEYGDEEIYQQFLEFYSDVVPEFKSVGKVVQFKVSCNFEPHLRGNVYVQYQTEDECLQAFTLFNGRWYASRQLQCEFSPVTRWKTAICGLFERLKCPRGKHCNFLHVFKNPNNEFWEANRDIHMSPDRTNITERRERTGRHNDHGRSRRYQSPSTDSTHKKNGESRRKKSSQNHKSKKKRSSRRSRSRDRRSRSRDRRSKSRDRRSKSRGRKKHKRKSRSSSRSRSRDKSSSSRSKSHDKKRSRSRSCDKRRSSSRSRSRDRRSFSRSRSRDRKLKSRENSVESSE
ncbi:U2 small nuclear ribonucleoprotein auxiliary factor 35 kDa subunit-related protein 2 [Bombina bombina]|uniref:U2 small nuclear ribonucleoprotein auxiliary factor 35 kDa subunit-related protein 2 n=1 Tax=Bombina bombina TaxID=8345 RepID=UPI00235A960E|nr:U2 small nuclear ribonucleoprotein auxiliary factor 35 kDa subunit-related protein 2 [Bombina bombina]